MIKNERRMVFPFAFSICTRVAAALQNSSAATLQNSSAAALQNSSAAPIRKAAPIGAFPLLRS